MPQPNYVAMHEIARHAIHSSEMLASALETMASMIQEYEVFFEENPSLSKETMTLSKQTRRTLRFQKTFLKCLHLRSKALEERLRNEINLVNLLQSPHIIKGHADDWTGVQYCRSI